MQVRIAFFHHLIGLCVCWEAGLSGKSTKSSGLRSTHFGRQKIDSVLKGTDVRAINSSFTTYQNRMGTCVGFLEEKIFFYTHPIFYAFFALHLTICFHLSLSHQVSYPSGGCIVWKVFHYGSRQYPIHPACIHTRAHRLNLNQHYKIEYSRIAYFFKNPIFCG